MRIRLIAVAAVVVAVGLPAGGVSRLAAQAAEPRIWQGVFSAAQADRGKEVFNTACIRCHGGDLAGTTAPALKGDRFYTSWGGEPVDRLFLKIRDTMPPNFGTILDDKAKLDIVAYILQVNGYPAGPGELALGGEDLAGAQILRKGQQAVVQNFSLVQTVGCLTRGGDNTWLLTRTAEPVSTREDGATPRSLESSAARPLGSRTFRLLSAVPFDPAAHVGQKMEARGLVYNDPVDSRLTLTSLQAAGSGCAG